MIILGTFIIGILVGCFIERRRLGFNSWACKHSYRCSRPRSRSTTFYQSGTAFTTTRSSSYNPQSRKCTCCHAKHNPSTQSNYPLESKVFKPISRRTISVSCLPRSRHHTIIRLPHNTNHKVNLDLIKSTSRYKRSHPKLTRKPTPFPRYKQQEEPEMVGKICNPSCIYITNIVNESPPRLLRKRWTEGMLFRKPRRYRTPTLVRQFSRYRL